MRGREPGQELDTILKTLHIFFSHIFLRTLKNSANKSRFPSNLQNIGKVYILKTLHIKATGICCAIMVRQLHEYWKLTWEFEKASIVDVMFIFSHQLSMQPRHKLARCRTPSLMCVCVCVCVCVYIYIYIYERIHEKAKNKRKITGPNYLMLSCSKFNYYSTEIGRILGTMKARSR